jgi:uncharacterized membrane protein YkvA (DUF1232 family)
VLERWKQTARGLEREALALWFACRDSRVPWHARLLALVVVGYALSPIDLIPDFIPVLGYVDELLLVPLAVAAARRMIPAVVMVEAQARAETMTSKPVSRVAAAVIVVLWIALAAATAWMAWMALRVSG